MTIHRNPRTSYLQFPHNDNGNKNNTNFKPPYSISLRLGRNLQIREFVPRIILRRTPCGRKCSLSLIRSMYALCK